MRVKDQIRELERRIDQLRNDLEIYRRSTQDLPWRVKKLETLALKVPKDMHGKPIEVGNWVLLDGITKLKIQRIRDDGKLVLDNDNLPVWADPYVCNPGEVKLLTPPVPSPGVAELEKLAIEQQARVRALYDTAYAKAKCRPISSTPPAPPPPITVDGLARLFHETYECLAPAFKYKTRQESAVSWDCLPKNNKQLMRAVCAEVLTYLNRKDGAE